MRCGEVAGDVGPVDVKCSAVELPGGACVPRGLLLGRDHGSVPGPLVVVVTRDVVPGEEAPVSEVEVVTLWVVPGIEVPV